MFNSPTNPAVFQIYSKNVPKTESHMMQHLILSKVNLVTANNTYKCLIPCYKISVNELRKCISLLKMHESFIFQMSSQYLDIAQRSPPSLLPLRHLDAVSHLLQV